MGTLIQDIRFGLRMLVKNPAVTIVAVITLALGIGANTAIFSTVNALFLRPLPVQHPERLIFLAPRQPGAPGYTQFSYPDFRDIRSQSAGVSDVLAYTVGLIGFDVDGNAEPIVVSYVSGNMFPALGLTPAAGRLISGEESENAATDPVIVLGYSYWKKKFNADPSIIGRQVKLNGHGATIVGVAPEGFKGLYSVLEMQAYLPMGMQSIEISSEEFWTRRDLRGLLALGMLNPGVSLKQAQTSTDVVARRIAHEYPDADKGLTIHLYPERMARPEPSPGNQVLIIGIIFTVLAGLVLLLACSNVANIVLARATVREREMAVRASLGAGRIRLVRQLLTESVLLALFGGLAGMLFGIWGSRTISSIRMEAPFPITLDFSFDWRVFIYGMLAALIAGILAGLVPAWRASRTDLNTVLHEGSRGTQAGSRRSRMRSVLVVAQVGASLMLLVAAGLFQRSARNAQNLYLGFDPSRLLNVGTDPHNVGMDREHAQLFYRQLKDRVRALPGVESATLAFSVPMGYYGNTSPVYVEGKEISLKQGAPDLNYNSVDEDYFTTMRTPVIAGRAFTQRDNEHAPGVAIVNAEMAKRFWPNQDPLGKRFSMKGPGGPFLEVVGVATTGKYFGPAENPLPFFYIPQAQDLQNTLRVIQVRTSTKPEPMIPVVVDQVHALAPGLAVFISQTMEQSLEGGNGFFFFHLASKLTAALGLLGLALALVGVYGVVSYVASQRVHEIGVRMALGATRGKILAMVLRQGFILVGGGILTGLALAYLAARSMSAFLVGVSPSDPVTFATVALLLAAVGLLASYIPARRAMRVEPLKALKYE
ncbi:MAG TPA: ABC transporter permease [Candidatus Angelobacter sp.]|nr:ABC transporter permease [Candidatus Angelobacter sp.]